MRKWKTALRNILLSLLLCGGGMLSGCQPGIKISESQTDQELFEQGKKYYEAGKYQDSLEYFLYIQEHFLRSSYAGIARFYAGEAYLSVEKYTDAASEYQSFLSFFPDDSLAPAAQYQLGMSYLQQASGPEQDQVNSQKALAEFQKIQKRYPQNTAYIEKSGKQIHLVKNDLALHELVVGKFYRKQKQYRASNRRFVYLIEMYPESNVIGEAVFYRGLNYLDLDQPEDAKFQFINLATQYPDNQYVALAQEKLAELGGKDVASPPFQQVNSHQNAVEGYVVLTQDDKIFTNLILKHGIQQGGLLNVYRENIFVGAIRIVEIQAGYSIATIESLAPGLTIQEKDRVVFQTPPKK